MFWEDIPVEKVKKEKVKPVPPEPIWLKPDYLPHLDKARAFIAGIKEQTLTAAELMAYKGQKMIFDCEVYPNYFLAAFKHIDSGKFIYFHCKRGHSLDREGLKWVLQNFCIIGFNIRGYDFPVSSLACAGKSTDVIFLCGSRIIEDQEYPYKVLKSVKVKGITEIDYIDLIEVCPIQASLKMYAGRLHCEEMQDLPFEPGTELSDDQIAITFWYCFNDLKNTQLIHDKLHQELKLRVVLSADYKVDLRSKSDAQIAEAVIREEIKRIIGRAPSKQTVEPGKRFRYVIPEYLWTATSPNLRYVLNRVANTDFEVGADGYVLMPPALDEFDVPLGGKMYGMGMGGLHSREKRAWHWSDENYILVDRDVESYYPRIALNQGLYPQHLTPAFLAVFDTIVKRRLAAKHSGNKIDAACLKIVINGTFGKLGEPHSIMYSPELLIQITLTGQLTLMLLIERAVAAGFEVISANTDGVTVKCLRSRKAEYDELIAQWERDTHFITEETQYAALFSKDVNNYFAAKYEYLKAEKRWTNKVADVKTKGIYANPWVDADDVVSQMKKNPTTTICTEAVMNLFKFGWPVEKTIRESKDMGKFVSVRKVAGGAYRDGVYFGKSVRWYYARDNEGPIINATSGARVPKSEGGKPLMEFRGEFPEDVDYEWYEREAHRILQDIGYEPKEKKSSKKALSLA
jgi:hypothetical protein